MLSLNDEQLSFAAASMSYSRKDKDGSSGGRQIPHTRIEDEKQIEDAYEFGNELGRGSFGVVKEAKHKATGKRWAVKAVNKEKVCMFCILFKFFDCLFDHIQVNLMLDRGQYLGLT